MRGTRRSPGGLSADAGPVTYWGGDIHPGLPMPGDEPLAVLLVTSTRARFVDTYPLDALIANLMPVEADFLTATGFGEDEAPAQPSADLKSQIKGPVHDSTRAGLGTGRKQKQVADRPDPARRRRVAARHLVRVGRTRRRRKGI
ncbi:hypothetical protein [Streptomyces sp. NPDC101776]|uniref:hypothetical protein n=1 Tax=Streptomyces sp. NPDC101776 TaxID=3366146 RepID=UPI003802C62E